MPRPMRDVTETELSILQVLWDVGPATVRQLVERLYPDAGPSAAPTVQKLLERLEGKEYVDRDRSGPAHRFRATVDRGALISAAARRRGRALRRLADLAADAPGPDRGPQPGRSPRPARARRGRGAARTEARAGETAREARSLIEVLRSSGGYPVRRGNHEAATQVQDHGGERSGRWRRSSRSA